MVFTGVRVSSLEWLLTVSRRYSECFVASATGIVQQACSSPVPTMISRDGPWSLELVSIEQGHGKDAAVAYSGRSSAS
jgi:hypothetical protein